MLVHSRTVDRTPSAPGWRALLGGALVLATMSQCAPADDYPSGLDTQGALDPTLAPVPEKECSVTPIAWWLGAESDADSTVVQHLESAGFEVQPLPLDASPSGLSGLILLGTDAAATPAYRDYMAEYASHLYHFVDRANVLVQMPQPAELEARPPFLPTTHAAERDGAVVDEPVVLSEGHPLLGGAPEGPFAWDGPDLARDSFVEQVGFEVLLAEDESAQRPVLMEGAYGQGRMLLSALPLDRADSPGTRPSAEAFFDALRQHTEDVCRRDVAPLEVTFQKVTDSFDAESEMLAVLPDTQVYSLSYPGMFLAQTAWIALHAESLRIRHVLHLGDVVNNNTDVEWHRARSAMALLDGVVPYTLAPGNHDYGPSGDASTRDTRMNDYFLFDDARAEPSFGGAFEEGKLDNTYSLLELWGRAFVVLALEWGPRDEVLQWADEVMMQHPDHLGILVTHAYLNHNDRRYDHTDTAHPQDYNPHSYATPGGVNDGEEIWQKLVRHHRFVMTLNGHVLGDGAGYLVSETDAGTRCHQMLVNWQMKELGGEGNIRLIELLPDEHTVQVHSYSALYDRLIHAPDHSYRFEIHER